MTSMACNIFCKQPWLLLAALCCISLTHVVQHMRKVQWHAM